MQLHSGEVAAVWDAGGDLRSPPVSDPLTGRLWVTSHGVRLAMLSEPRDEYTGCQGGSALELTSFELFLFRFVIDVTGTSMCVL